MILDKRLKVSTQGIGFAGAGIRREGDGSVFQGGRENLFTMDLRLSLFSLCKCLPSRVIAINFFIIDISYLEKRERFFGCIHNIFFLRYYFHFGKITAMDDI